MGLCITNNKSSQRRGALIRQIGLIAGDEKFGSELSIELERIGVHNCLILTLEQLTDFFRKTVESKNTYLLTTRQALGQEFAKFISSDYIGQCSIPIIFLTDEVDDIKRLFALGVEACLPMRHVREELEVQLNAIDRRRDVKENEQYLRCTPKEIIVGDISLNLNDHTVNINGRLVILTEKEYRILRVMETAAGRLMKREEIRDRIQGLEEGGEIDWENTISRLRKKLGRRAGNYIKTKYGVGYALRPPLSKRIIS